MGKIPLRFLCDVAARIAALNVQREMFLAIGENRPFDECLCFVRDIDGRKSMLATTDPSPVWVPDADASTCMCCRKSEFSLVNRRVRMN